MPSSRQLRDLAVSVQLHVNATDHPDQKSQSQCEVFGGLGCPVFGERVGGVLLATHLMNCDGT